jgi:hypothetical protein
VLEIGGDRKGRRLRSRIQCWQFLPQVQTHSRIAPRIQASRGLTASVWDQNIAD